MSNCQENIIKDVVGIDILTASACNFPVPFNVRDIKSIPLSAIPKPKYHFGFNADSVSDYSDEVDGDITVKSTNKTSALGNIFTYDISAVVDAVSDLPYSVEKELYHFDFHLIIHFADGTAKLCYGLPSTSIYSANENYGSNSSIAIKIAIQSINKLIELL